MTRGRCRLGGDSTLTDRRSLDLTSRKLFALTLEERFSGDRATPLGGLAGGTGGAPGSSTIDRTDASAAKIPSLAECTIRHAAIHERDRRAGAT